MAHDEHSSSSVPPPPPPPFPPFLERRSRQPRSTDDTPEQGIEDARQDEPSRSHSYVREGGTHGSSPPPASCCFPLSFLAIDGSNHREDATTSAVGSGKLVHQMLRSSSKRSTSQPPGMSCEHMSDSMSVVAGQSPSSNFSTQAPTPSVLSQSMALGTQSDASLILSGSSFFSSAHPVPLPSARESDEWDASNDRFLTDFLANVQPIIGLDHNNTDSVVFKSDDACGYEEVAEEDGLTHPPDHMNVLNRHEMTPFRGLQHQQPTTGRRI